MCLRVLKQGVLHRKAQEINIRMWLELTESEGTWDAPNRDLTVCGSVHGERADKLMGLTTHCTILARTAQDLSGGKTRLDNYEDRVLGSLCVGVCFVCTVIVSAGRVETLFLRPDVALLSISSEFASRLITFHPVGLQKGLLQPQHHYATC